MNHRLSLLVLGSILACRPSVPDGSTEPSIRPEPAVVPDAAPPALTGHEWLEPLGDDAHELAKVSIPQGTTTARPILLAFHGAQDRAEWSCGEWRGVTNAFPFIVCPRGDKSGLYYDAPKKTYADTELAIAEARNRFAGFVDARDPPVIAGFSMGAAEVIALLVQTPLTAPALALVEGGYESLALAGVPTVIARRGVKRVLLACTTLGWCPTQYAAARKALLHVGIEVHYLQAAAKDHGMYPEVTTALAKEMPWLWEPGTSTPPPAY